jgi:hypothetical protein
VTATGKFRTFARWAIWPVLVVLALNIENRAKAWGLDAISPSALAEAMRASEVYQSLTSDTALYVALFLAGGCTFAWLGRMIEVLDRSDRWAINGLSTECENLANALDGFLFMPLGSNARLNKKLARFGFDPIPEKIDRRSREQRERVARYLRAIGPAMKSDLAYAQGLGSAALHLNKEMAITRRADPNSPTES